MMVQIGSITGAVRTVWAGKGFFASVCTQVSGQVSACSDIATHWTCHSPPRPNLTSCCPSHGPPTIHKRHVFMRTPGECSQIRPLERARAVEVWLGMGGERREGSSQTNLICHVIFLQVANIYPECLFPPKEKKT